MIRILNLNNLVQLLREGEVQVSKILIILSIIIVFESVIGHPGFVYVRGNLHLLPFVILHFFASLTSLWLAYFANGGAKGREFFLRFIPISSVTSFWIWVIGYIAMVGVYWGLYFLLRGHSMLYSIAYTATQLGYAGFGSLAYILCIQHFIAKTSGAVAS